MIRVVFLYFIFILPLNIMANDVNLVPDSYDVPIKILLPKYSFLKVNPDYSKLDYEALMSAKEFIREELNTDWPSDDFSLKENTESLIGDLNSFNKRTNFTFHIFNSDQSKMIGCFYISNGSEAKYDASVFIWVRKEYLSTPLFIEIKSDIKNWISKDWPLKSVDYSLNKT
jgi:hypothetical protein